MGHGEQAVETEHPGKVPSGMLTRHTEGLLLVLKIFHLRLSAVVEVGAHDRGIQMIPIAVALVAEQVVALQCSSPEVLM